MAPFRLFFVTKMLIMRCITPLFAPRLAENWLIFVCNPKFKHPLKRTTMKRRQFLQQSALASTALLAPAFLQGAEFGPLAPRRNGKILVVIQCSGGNDGLNTIVPYQDDIYYKNRPSLAIPKNEVLKISDQLGLNPALQAMQPLYDQGLLSMVNSVGYPNPDRSHFRSMDIWHTASDASEYWKTGWLGRYLDSQCAGCQNPYHAIEVDDTLSLALKGEQRRGFAISDPNRLKNQASNGFLRQLSQAPVQAQEENVAYLYKTLVDTQSSAEYLADQAKAYRSTVTYPASDLGKDLKLIAQLIMADTDTKVYYASLTGFDTHANQKGRQDRLLKTYAEAVKAFVSDLQQNKLMDEVLILTFSEFGRRVKQNGSGGTDHGTANNAWLIGSKLKKPGFFNAGPNLQNLDEGDLRYEIDFRDLYADLLQKWLGAPVRDTLGRDFKGLGLI
jgi:uncharacterized protein (DUF1501 family)